MNTWFEALSGFEKIYWIVAGISSIIFVILLILTLIGGEVEDLGDVDTEIDGDTGIDFQFLSFKNLMGFFTLFGWSGIACIQNGAPQWVTVIVSVICGLLMMTAMAALFYYLGKMQSSGTLNLKNAINTEGEVYLTVGANRSKMGKVQVKVQNGLRDLDALTDSESDLTQGTIITVTDVTNTGILIVKQL